MELGIIGSGNIGSTAARLFVAAGYRVAIGNRSGSPMLSVLADELGPNLRPTTVDKAAGFGEAVLLAIPFASRDDLPVDAFSGRIVIDATNYYPSPDYHMPDLDNRSTTSTEMLAAHLRSARLVKAFNTLRFSTLASHGDPMKAWDYRLALFIAGDDPEAKRLVNGIVDDLGFAPIDTGSLPSGGRCQQPGTPLFDARLTGAQARKAVSAND
jgi:8-hydroxy-5-deazaflavin:NADPH oxidoreductase